MQQVAKISVQMQSNTSAIFSQDLAPTPWATRRLQYLPYQLKTKYKQWPETPRGHVNEKLKQKPN